MPAIYTALAPEEVDMIGKKMIFSQVPIVLDYVFLTHSRHSEKSSSCGGNEGGHAIRVE